MKKMIEAFDYAGTVCKAMPRGILLTTKADGKVNTMTIGWGHIGIEWGKPIFVAYVRESRYTKQMLEANGEFTINVPMGSIDGKILGYCGTKSGRDTDKIRDKNLITVESDVVSAPGIVQFPLTLECRVIYRQEQEIRQMPQGVVNRFYPPFGETKVPDMHTAFYGEIVNAYLIEQD